MTDPDGVRDDSADPDQDADAPEGSFQVEPTTQDELDELDELDTDYREAD